VSCVSAASCVAVGADLDISGSQPKQVTLAETWNGTTWSLATTPDDGAADLLAGVSCSSSTNCAAVGINDNGSVDQTLSEIWNGSDWTLVPSPSPGTNAILNGVSCSDSTHCVAVGQIFHSSVNTSKAWAERWNGSAWRRLRVTPRP
jgi:hypothetical protein